MTSLLLIAVFAVAVIFSMLGLGGGVLYVPILLQAGVSFHAAVATSLAIILIMSLTASAVYHMEKLIDWKLIMILEPISVIGAVLGSLSSNHFSVKVLYVIFALSMTGSALFMLMAPKKVLALHQKSKLPGIIHMKKNGEHYSINMWAGVPLFFLAGFISSLIGIGGGFLKVPLMTIIFGVPIKIAVATSSAMIVITALSGLFGHSAVGHVDWHMTAILSAVVFAGALIGSKISIKADRKIINLMFSIVQFSVAGWMVYMALKP